MIARPESGSQIPPKDEEPSMRTKSLTVVVLVLVSLFIAPRATASEDWIDTGITKDFVNRQGTQVLNLRYAAHEAFDRVVIDLSGPMSDYRTGYARRFHYDGSGKQIPIRGSSGLWIGLTADGHDAAGNNLYTGPRIARPRLDTLKALAVAGDFEGQVTFRVRATPPGRIPDPASERTESTGHRFPAPVTCSVGRVANPT